MRLLVVSLALVALLAACGGGSPSPTVSPSATPGAASGLAQACSGDDIHASFVSSAEYSGVIYLTFGFSSEKACGLPGPPGIQWFDKDGNQLHPVSQQNAPPCASARGDNSACISQGTVNLEGTGGPPTFSGEHPAAIVAVDDASLRKCIERPGVPAASIAFAFEGADEASAELPTPLSFDCGAGARLAGYGAHVNAANYAANCTVGDLAASWAFTGVALGTEYYEFGLSNLGPEDCNLGGPPVVRLLTADDSDLGLSYDTNTPCSPGSFAYPQVSNETDCVTGGPLYMYAGRPAPEEAVRGSGEATLTIAIANTANFDPPCATTGEARYLALQFPGSAGELRVAFPQGIEVQTCYPQLRLHRFN